MKSTSKVCHKTLKNPQGLKQHMRDKRLIDPDSTCEVCHKTLKNPQGLKQHMRDKHHILVYSDSTCEVCHKTLKNPQVLKQHMRDKHHILVYSDSTCGACHKTLKNPEGLEQHMRDKHHILVYSDSTCGACHKTLKNPEGLEQHMRDKHHILVYSDSTCGACHKTLKNPQGLKQHMRDKRHDSDPLTDQSLRNYVEKHVQPGTAFKTSTSRAINNIVQVLQQNATQIFGTTAKMILKSGSLAKGTAVDGKSDIDLVIFLNGYSSVEKLEEDMPRLLRGAREFFERKSDLARVHDTTAHSLEVEVTGSHGVESHKIDLLPTVDLLSSCTPETVYKQMAKKGPIQQRFYSASLAPLQLKFLEKCKQEGGKTLQDLIRLIKDWKKSKIDPLPKGNRYKFPTSYYYELVTIHCWKQAGEPRSFDLLKAQRAVLENLQNCQNQKIVFEENYKQSDSFCKNQGDQYIMDPANPFNDVTSRFDGWDIISRKAGDYVEAHLARTPYSSTQW